VALRVNPEHILNHYTSVYIQALAAASTFLERDLLVPDDLSGLENLFSLRCALYKRVSKAYATRYRAKAEIHITELKSLKSAYTGVKWKRWPNSAKKQAGSLKEIITRYQWRLKCYPRLIPTDPINREFDPQVYLDATYSMLNAYARKRKKSGLETEVARLVAGDLYPGGSLFRKLRHMAEASGLDLMQSYQDVVLKRNQTLDDVDGFIKYDTHLLIPTGEYHGPLDWDDVLSDTSDVEEVPETLDISDFLPTLSGFAALKPSNLVQLKFELSEDGIPNHAIEILHEQHGWLLPDLVTLEMYQEYLVEAKNYIRTVEHEDLYEECDDEPDIG
jgi:hypothetical protein